MVKRRCRVIFAAVCGYFCNGVRYFLRRERFCYIIFAVVFFASCFLSLYFLRSFFHLSQFIFTPVWVYFYTCLSLFSHLSQFIFTPVWVFSFDFFGQTNKYLRFDFSTFWEKKKDIFGEKNRLFEGRNVDVYSLKANDKGWKKNALRLWT